MKLLDRLFDWFGQVPQFAPDAPAPMKEAAGTTIDDDEALWRPLTGHQQRDLTPLEQTRMQRLAAYLWERNPLGNRLIELPVAYILGEGVRLACKNEDGQKALDAWWRDPINAMDVKLEAMVREARLYGEQCYPVFENTATGFLRLGYLDPALIEAVITDPDNGAQPIGVRTVKDAAGRSRTYRVIVGGDDADLFTQATRALRVAMTDGECFYLRRNNLLSGKRGRSAMLAQMDWLDGYDEFLFGELDGARDRRSFFYDVEMTGATEEQIEARAAKIAAPGPRAIRFHNENEKWTVQAPKLEANDVDAAARLFRTHVLGGATLPEHWYAAGGDVNRATASEMAEPTEKVLTQEQRAWKAFLELIGRTVLERARNLGYDAGDAEWQVEAIFPELKSRDITKYAAALQQVVAASVNGIDHGLMTEGTALRLIASVTGRLGVEFDAVAELAAAKAEADARKMAQQAADTFNGPMPADDGGAPA